ncbi:MAG: hypothetical protein E7662_10560 [Ruminococcaceae bacterium]|nr:hypothetical protein [Oscillospiraceae bacterium]
MAERKENPMKKSPKKNVSTNCESCVYYDYNEIDDVYECGVDLDEDEFLAFLTKKTQGCPYYKFYDEYKSVRKQN